MADSGRLAGFKFGSVTYDADDCLQGWDIADSINDVVYQCNSMDKHARGTQNVIFRVPLALQASDTTIIAAFAPGTSATTFEAWPGGYTTNYIEFASTDVLVLRRDLSAAINGIITADIEIAINSIASTLFAA